MQHSINYGIIFLTVVIVKIPPTLHPMRMLFLIALNFLMELVGTDDYIFRNPFLQITSKKCLCSAKLEAKKYEETETVTKLS